MSIWGCRNTIFEITVCTWVFKYLVQKIIIFFLMFFFAFIRLLENFKNVIFYSNLKKSLVPKFLPFLKSFKILTMILKDFDINPLKSWLKTFRLLNKNLSPLTFWPRSLMILTIRLKLFTKFLKDFDKNPLRFWRKIFKILTKNL